MAILSNEPERRALNEAIAAAENRLLSVVSLVEASMVMEARHGYDGVRDLDLFLAKAQIDLVPVGVEQAHSARRAFRAHGTGRHAAALNFGDLFSYALAKATGQPLLFKGHDVSHTDIEAVPLSAGEDEPPQSAGQGEREDGRH